MTDEQRRIISKALVNLDVALVNKTPKSFMRVMVWQAREELMSLFQTNLDEPKNVHHEKECGK